MLLSYRRFESFVRDFTSSRHLKALGALSRAARGFEAQYKGKVGPLFASALQRFETLQAKAAEAVSFAGLAADRNLKDTSKQIARARVENYVLTKVTPHLLFFELEACSLPSEWLSVHLNTSAFVRSRRPYLSQLLKQRRHLLSLEVEVVLEGRKPYDAKLAATTILKRELGIVRFDSPFPTQEQQQQQQGQQQQQRQQEEEEAAEAKGTGPQTVSLSEAQGATRHKDAQVRARALEAIDKGVRALRLDVLASVSLNAVAGVWGCLRSKRNLSFGVPDAAVSALVAAVRLEGPALAARFYRLKRQILAETQGLERFTFADRLAPVSLSPNEATFSWASAVSLVEASFSSYLPFCTSEFAKLLSEKRIDAAPGKFKRPGSFTRPASPETGPFVFLSFSGSARDVKALAREATHACLLSLRAPLGPLAWSPPPALAETAARIGERIINDRLRAAATTGLERLDQLMNELDAAVNSILRQISFDRFEELVHDARQSGLLFPEQFEQLWIQATKEMFGSEETVFDAFGPIRSTWATVLHFHTLPFGVYLFALAPLTAEVVAARIEAEPAKVQQRLFEVLSGKGGEDHGLSLVTQDKASRTDKRGDSRGEAGAATAAAAGETAASSNSERNKVAHPKVDSVWQLKKVEQEDNMSPLQFEEDSAEAELRDDPREVENEALLFSQIFEALDLNPQDVQLWAHALKRHLGERTGDAAVASLQKSRRRVSLLQPTLEWFVIRELTSNNNNDDNIANNDDDDDNDNGIINSAFAKKNNEVEVSSRRQTSNCLLFQTPMIADRAGDLLTEAEALRRKLGLSLLNKAASRVLTEQPSASN
ncbi:hypothetical protein Esti_006642 [Eimeria stiedai]